MTPDQKATLDCLGSVIAAPRQEGRHDAIKRAYREYISTLKKVPWWKRLLNYFFVKSRTPDGRAVRGPL